MKARQTDRQTAVRKPNTQEARQTDTHSNRQKEIERAKGARPHRLQMARYNCEQVRCVSSAASDVR